MHLLSSLKRALTFHFLLVAIVPVFLFGLVNIQVVSDKQLAGVRDHNMRMAQDIRGEVESFLLEVSADLRLVESALAAPGVLQPAGLDGFLAAVVHSSQFFESIYLLNPDRKILSLGVLVEDPAWRADYTQLDFSAHQLFDSRAPFNTPRWSNTYISLVTGEPSVTLGIPVKQGFLLGNLSLINLSRLLQKYVLNGHVQAAVIDQTGTVIAHNDLALAMQRVNFGNRPVVVSALAGREETSEFKQGSYVSLESAALISPPAWVVWVGLDLDEVLAPIEKMRHLLLAFMGLALCLAAALALFNLRRLMRPLTSLGEQASQIAGGNYALHISASGYEEIDELAVRFTSMSQAIQVREESIITSEQRFRDLVNSIDGIVWEMDYPSFRFLFVSQKAESLLGYPVQSWLEDPGFWESKISPEDMRQAKAYCQLMAEKQLDHSFEYRMTAADGRLVWIRDLVTVISEQGRPTRLLGVMLDVTVQKELLEDLSRSEMNYREIFNASSDAIFIHDAYSGQVVDVNRAMLAMFRCTYEDALLGGTAGYSEGVSPYSEIEAKEKLRIALEEGSCTFPWRARRATGELFWAEVSLQRGMIGGQKRILAAVRDITERKEAENELAGYRAHLEALVQERTRQLGAAQSELVQKERLAVLGRLTATVSHEIRNPLGTIANSLYLVRNALSAEGLAGLERPLALAERNVERCDSIISELLDFSRQRILKTEPVEIDRWLRELLDELNFPAGLNRRWELASAVTLFVEPERLRRAMVNVVTNALQALDEVPENRRSLVVRTRTTGDRCEIEVSDSGPGMSQELMDKIFEPMFSTKNFGVGLGVPIIRNILESHGGGVEYRSEVGNGTAVTLWLPLANAVSP